MHHRLSEYRSALCKEQESGRFLGEILSNTPFRCLFSFRIEGIADLLVVPADIPSFVHALHLAACTGVPYAVLGGGSNLLPPDGGYHGVLISTKYLNRISVCGEKFKAECGTDLNRLILAARDRSRGGLAPLYGIPASVGGAVYMNAGAHATSVADRFCGALLFDPLRGEKHFFEKEDMAFSYRSSILQREKQLVLLYAVFSFHEEERTRISASIANVLEKRRKTQPLSLPSAGSAFRRPREGIEVWRLIDACGLRGFSVGGAQISEKHAGFIVNRGGARSEDVCALIALARSRVRERFDISLTPEIEFLRSEGGSVDFDTLCSQA